MPRAVVHIGTHKTGTTSFQNWGDTHRSEIQRRTGYRFYESAWDRAMIEFPILSVRPELDLHARVRAGVQWVTPEVQRDMRTHIKSQLDGQDLIISAEGLSFIRTTDEVDRLHELLAPYELEFIVVLREQADFLSSYSQWMKKLDIKQSKDPESCRYLGTDSWIIDFDRFPKLFPGIKIIEYRQAMHDSGSIIPAIMEGIGTETSMLPGWSEYKLNPTLSTRARALRTFTRRMTRHRKRDV